MVYDEIPKLPSKYRSLGKQEIIVSNNLAYLPGLGIGSIVIKKTPSYIALEGGFLVNFDLKEPIKSMEDFRLKGIFWTKKLYAETKRFAAETARSLSIISNRIHSLEKLLCLQKEG